MAEYNGIIERYEEDMQNEYEGYTLMRNLIMILLLLGSYPTYAETTIVRFFVNGEAHTLLFL